MSISTTPTAYEDEDLPRLSRATTRREQQTRGAPYKAHGKKNHRAQKEFELW